MPKNFVIKPMKQLMTLDKKQAQELWTLLSQSIDEIYNKNASNLSFEELYRFSYQLVMTKHGEFLYNNVKQTFQRHLHKMALCIESSRNEDLLQTCASQWLEHKVTAGLIKDVLMYMDNTFVVQQKLVGTFNLSLICFRDIIIYNPNIRLRLRQELLSSIALERKGHSVDQESLRIVLSMLCELCLEGVNVYEEEFESTFLEETRVFYTELSLTYLSMYNTPQYLAQVEDRLAEEAARVNAYLSQASEPKLRALAENVLLEMHARSLLDSDRGGAHNLFLEDRYEDLRRMFSLFSRVSSCLDMFRETMVQYVKAEGTKIVADQEKSTDPVQFMQRIFDLKAKFDVIIENCCRNEKKFQRRLKEALEDFINRDCRCSSYLAAYVDNVLKSGSQSESGETIDSIIERVLVLFRYLSDKDVFENFHRQHLAKRLLSSRSASEDNEKLVVARLKAECGNQYTAKLEGMLTDMVVSRSTMDEYRQTDSFKINEVELDTLLLTNGHWPSQFIPPCNLPRPLKECQDSYSNFYTNHNSGRRLIWQHNLGFVDIRASFKGGKRDLNVSTYQACILNLFNDSTSLSLDDIRQATNIPEAELRRHLLSLCTPKFRILNKSSKDKVCIF